MTGDDTRAGEGRTDDNSLPNDPSVLTESADAVATEEERNEANDAHSRHDLHDGHCLHDSSATGADDDRGGGDDGGGGGGVVRNHHRDNGSFAPDNEADDDRFEDDDLDVVEDSETRCGLFGCVPQWMQVCASKKAFTIAYGLLGMSQFALSTYLVGSISTIEKRFKMPTRTSGLISSAADVGYMAVLFLAYFGRHGNKPLWVGLGGILASFSAMGRILPHLLYGPGYDAIQLAQLPRTSELNETLFEPDEGKSLCGKHNPGMENCEDNSQSIIVAIIFILCQMIHGFGVSSYWSLGVTYLDDNVRKDKVAILISITAFMRSLGPMLGFIVSWISLEMYVDPHLTPTIGSKDPRWIGAWWYGWIPLSLFSFAMSLALIFFPKSMPRAAMRRRRALRRIKETQMRIVEDGKAEKEKEADRIEKDTANGDDDDDDAYGNVVNEVAKEKTLSEFFTDIRRLMGNRLLTLNMIAALFYMFGMMGYWQYLPKYMETQFHVSASHANIVSGSVGLVFSGIGLLISGGMITLFKPSARFLAAWNTCVELIDALGHYMYAFIGCPADADKFHGSYNPDHTWNLTASCNAGCNCTNAIRYDPVCSLETNQSFYSPCHAGCEYTSFAADGSKLYMNCSCVAGTTGLSSVVPGFCPVDCTSEFHKLVILMSVLRLISSTTRSGSSIIQFRCVAPEDKSLSIGMMEMALILLAFLPAPIIFGMILDNVCLVWGETCGSTGNCWLYDADKMRYYLNFTASTFLMLAACADLGVFYYAKGLKIYDDEDEDKKKKKSKKKKKTGEGNGELSEEAELLILRAVQSPVAVKKSDISAAN